MSKKIEKEKTNEFESAKEYFEILKGRKQKIDLGKIENIYENCISLVNKYTITGQTDALRKLLFHIETLEKEKEIISLGIDTFVYLSDIKEYIEKVPGRVVKVIELSRYERDVPEDVVESIRIVKDIFSELVVVFTDYTKDHEKKQKKETDPIVFGMFKDTESNSVVERMYFIGDWEDEYCDLTFDKLLAEMKECTGNNIEHKIKYPEDLAELKEQLKTLESNRNEFEKERFVVTPVKKKSFVKRATTFLSRKK